MLENFRLLVEYFRFLPFSTIYWREFNPPLNNKDPNFLQKITTEGKEEEVTFARDITPSHFPVSYILVPQKQEDGDITGVVHMVRGSVTDKLSFFPADQTQPVKTVDSDMQFPLGPESPIFAVQEERPAENGLPARRITHSVVIYTQGK